jgi:hypothetical protein
MRHIAIAMSIVVTALLAAGCNSSGSQMSATPGSNGSQESTSSASEVRPDGEVLWNDLSEMGRQALCSGPLNQTKLDFFIEITFSPDTPTDRQLDDFVAQLRDAYERRC